MLYNLTLCRRCLTRWVSGQHIRLKSHYAVLGVSPNASQKEIRNAFLDLSKKYHPDQNKTNSNSHEKFVQISESYSVLSKPLSRQEYDAKLRYSSASSINNNYQRYPFKGPPPGYQGPPPGYPGYDPYSHDNPFYRGPYGSRGPYSQGQYGQKRPGQGFKEDPFSQHGYEFYQRQREAEYNHAFENFLRYNRRRRQENVKQFRKGLKLFTMWMIVIYILTFLGFLILYSSLLLSGSDSLRNEKMEENVYKEFEVDPEYRRNMNVIQYVRLMYFGILLLFWTLSHLGYSKFERERMYWQQQQQDPRLQIRFPIFPYLNLLLLIWLLLFGVRETILLEEAFRAAGPAKDRFAVVVGCVTVYLAMLMFVIKSGISRKKRQREDLEDISAAAEYLRERNSKK